MQKESRDHEVSHQPSVIAIVGQGYWGPNLLRTFLGTQGCSVRYCCDLRQEVLSEVKRRLPHITTTTDIRDVISDPEVGAVVLATPTATHFELGQQVLDAGKDVLIEKPMTRSTKEAWKLVELAERNKRVLMVDHVLLFNPAVLRVKELIDKGEIGEILYIDSTRTSLGRFQQDINVIYDLASHEFAMLQYFLGNTPKVTSVTGKSHINGQIDVAYITARYPKDILVHVHITWLSPLKVRRMLIVGDRKMIVYDDNEPSEKVKVYDKGITYDKNGTQGEPFDNQRQIKIGYRIGDMWSPNIEIADPLSLLAKSFISSISTREEPRSGGKFSAEVVEILERATQLFNRQKL